MAATTAVAGAVRRETEDVFAIPRVRLVRDSDSRWPELQLAGGDEVAGVATGRQRRLVTGGENGLWPAIGDGVGQGEGRRTRGG